MTSGTTVDFDDDFQELVVNTNRTRGNYNRSMEPKASINYSSYILRFNGRAVELYGIDGNTHVKVVYSKKAKVLGLRIVPEGTPNTLKFYNKSSKTKKGKPTKDHCIGIRQAFEQYNLQHKTQSGLRTTYDAETRTILVHDVQQSDSASFSEALRRAKEADAAKNK